MKATKHYTTDNGDGTLTIEGTCPITGKDWSLVAPTTPYEKWINRDLLIQEAFPGFTPAQREMLMTGITAEGWAQMFGPGEED